MKVYFIVPLAFMDITVTYAIDAENIKQFRYLLFLECDLMCKIHRVDTAKNIDLLDPVRSDMATVAPP